MKRLVFFVAALFAVCLGAMAQPQASIFSWGFDNEATIRQSPNYNTAKIVQDFGYSFDNKATILQCSVNGWNNEAEIWQAKSDNEATVIQSGSFNKAIVTQWGHQDNVVEVEQGGGIYNTAFVTQHLGAIGNKVDFKQWGNYLTANIDQKGEFNKVKLIQGGNNGNVDIEQDGNENQIRGINTLWNSFDPSPYAYFAGSDLDVYQKGNQNTLRLFSNCPGGVVDVDQIGDRNMATVLQTTEGLCNPCIQLPPTPRACPFTFPCN